MDFCYRVCKPVTNVQQKCGRTLFYDIDNKGQMIRAVPAFIDRSHVKTFLLLTRVF
jgi:hypothetical protein